MTAQDNAAPRTCARTDAKGSYAFAALPVGTYEVEASAEGHVTTRATARIDASKPARLNITLPLPARASGIVIDKHGVPVRGARLEVFPYEGPPPDEPPDDPNLDIYEEYLEQERTTIIALTDENGRFDIVSPEGPGPYVFWLSHLDFEDHDTIVRLPKQLRFVLRPKRRITGRVIESDARALRYTWVFAEDGNGETYKGMVGRNGCFVINGLRPGKHTVNIGSDRKKAPTLEVRVGKTTDPPPLVAVLDAAVDVEGRIVAPPLPMPLRNIGKPFLRTKRDTFPVNDASFRLRDVPADVSEVTLSVPGYLPLQIPIERQSKVQTLLLDPGRAVRGKVRHRQSGAPLKARIRPCSPTVYLGFPLVEYRPEGAFVVHYIARHACLDIQYGRMQKRVEIGPDEDNVIIELSED